jgi:ribosome modulation factor
MNDVTQYNGGDSAVANMEANNLPLAVQLAQVELNQAVTTAHAFPRSMQRARDNITALVMLDEETAAECIYALPRGGKPIKGPSVRFAEIIASQYGNCHVGSRVIEVNKFEKYVEAEGVFHDLETGMKRTARTRRRIVDKGGRLFNDDMILVTSNAACSIALREAILKGVPKALWRAAYDAADAVICGDVKTLSVRRADALKAFATFGVTPDQIFASLDIEGADEITPDHIGTLTAMFKAIKSGEMEAEEYFPAKVDAKAAVGAAKGTAAKLSEIAASKGKAKAVDKEAQKEADHKAAEGNRADDAARQAMQDERDAKAKAASDEADSAATGDDGPQGGQDAEDADANDAAYQRGRKAHGRGMKSDAIPNDLKGDEIREAWVGGWKDARDEAEGGDQ